MVNRMVRDAEGQVTCKYAERQGTGLPQISQHHECRQEDQQGIDRGAQDRGCENQRCGPPMVFFVPAAKRLDMVKHEAVQHVLDQRPSPQACQC